MSNIESIHYKVDTLLEKSAVKYHLAVCWVALLLNPIFAITDYYNIPNYWMQLLLFRMLASGIILIVVLLRNKLNFNSSTIIIVPFLLICSENAWVYSVIDMDNLNGHNLNFMAMFIGAGMFLLWRWHYSLIILIVSLLMTSLYIYLNPIISWDTFFVNGGLLLIVSGIFMAILVHTRYTLTLKSITAQVMLEKSNIILEAQAREIRAMNDTLEQKVYERTKELIDKNKTLEDYTFKNSHNLRSPVANILGLIALLSQTQMDRETTEIFNHLKSSSEKLDDIVNDITSGLES